MSDTSPGAPAVLDWDATLGFRHDLWSLGLGVAEAMDTAQRGMGLDWPTTQELIRRVGAEAASVGGRLVVRRRHRPSRSRRRTPIDVIVRAYAEQVAAIEEPARAIV